MLFIGSLPQLKYHQLNNFFRRSGPCKSSYCCVICCETVDVISSRLWLCSALMDEASCGIKLMQKFKKERSLMDVAKNGHKLFLNARLANLPFRPYSSPERAIMKACDSAQAPFEMRDYWLVLVWLRGNCHKLFWVVCVGVWTVPVFRQETPQPVSRHLAQMEAPFTG